MSLSVSTIILAILLGVTFWRLYSLNKQLEGIFCDVRLLAFHYISFLLATVNDVAIFAMQTTSTALYEADNPDTMDTRLRLDIAGNFFNAVQVIFWFTC